MKMIPNQCKHTACYACIYSGSSYGIEIDNSCGGTQQNRLQIVMNKLIKLLFIIVQMNCLTALRAKNNEYTLT